MVATASLELGIDMGAVDLVCQVESPGSVARGLQRVGRAGHVVRRVSKGRLIAKTPSRPARIGRGLPGDARRRDRAPAGPDRLPRRPGAAGGRLRGDGAVGRAGAVRPGPLRLPVPRPDGRGVRERAPDGLGPVPDARFSRPPRAGELGPGPQPSDTRCPARRSCALVGGGTIPDTGQYPVYLGDGRPAAGRARRGIRLRAAGGRNLRAGQRRPGGSRRSSRTGWSSPRPRVSRP